jgi:tripartite-type tricarboxylate transporter receptor subunit TctC
MRAHMGQPVIIENLSGADGSIGVGRAARARPDGYTLCFSTLTYSMLRFIRYHTTCIAILFLLFH